MNVPSLGNLTNVSPVTGVLFAPDLPMSFLAAPNFSILVLFCTPFVGALAACTASESFRNESEIKRRSSGVAVFAGS